MKSLFAHSIHAKCLDELHQHPYGSRVSVGNLQINTSRERWRSRKMDGFSRAYSCAVLNIAAYSPSSICYFFFLTFCSCLTLPLCVFLYMAFMNAIKEPLICGEVFRWILTDWQGVKIHLHYADPDHRHDSKFLINKELNPNRKEEQTVAKRLWHMSWSGCHEDLGCPKGIQHA